jgi:cytochrome c
MNRNLLGPALAPTIAAVALALALPAYAADDEAVKKLLKRNDCFKCHAVDKTKKGPSYKKIAAKYKNKRAEGEQKMHENITTGPKVKLEDGTEEDHKIIDTKDPKQISDVIEWILSR